VKNQVLKIFLINLLSNFLGWTLLRFEHMSTQKSLPDGLKIETESLKVISLAEKDT